MANGRRVRRTGNNRSAPAREPRSLRFVLQRSSTSRRALPTAAAPVEVAAAERDRAQEQVARAMADLLTRWLDEPDDGKRSALRAEFDKLAERQTTLMAFDLKEILATPEVQSALETLRRTNASLRAAVKEMRDATDAIARAAAVLGFADRAIGLLAGLFL